MDRLGFIHEELDIKILILFILSRLPGQVEPETLQELCQSDSGVGYFEYSQCLSELVETGHVTEGEQGYAITEKGKRNVNAVESSLPYSVRSKVLKLMVPVEERLLRASMIKTSHKNENGCTVSLSMSDGVGELISLRLICADEQQAKLMERNFRRSAEDYYQKIVSMLSEDKKRGK